MTMSKCAIGKDDWTAFLSGELEEGRRRTMAEHIAGCPDCRAEAEDMKRVLARTAAVKAEIREAVASVNWEALPALIADRAMAGARAPEKAPRDGKAWSWMFSLRLRPVLAGLAAGLVVGAAAMYFALRMPGPRQIPDTGYYASGEFLDRAELEMARRNTLDYLKKSQYVLLDVFESGGEGLGPAAFNSEQARDLLSRKKYLNAQLERFQMAKAKAICDQIEMLFRELSQISEELPAAELDRIKGIVEERQLLLKINLVRKELEREI
jgi:Putative zinc-finger